MAGLDTRAHPVDGVALRQRNWNMPPPAGWVYVIQDSDGASKLYRSDGVKVAISGGISELDWFDSMSQQIAMIEPTLRRRAVRCEFLSANGAGTAVDWGGAFGGGVDQVNTTDPGGIAHLFTAGQAGAASAVRVLGLPFVAPDQLHFSWAICARVTITAYAAAGNIGLICLGGADNTTAINFGVLSSQSTTSLSVWTATGASLVTVGVAPVTTTYPIASVTNAYKDLALIYDGVTARAYVGDYRIGVPLAFVGEQENNSAYSGGFTSPFAWIQSGGANADSRIDSLVAHTGFSP